MMPNKSAASFHPFLTRMFRDWSIAAAAVTSMESPTKSCGAKVASASSRQKRCRATWKTSTANVSARGGSENRSGGPVEIPLPVPLLRLAFRSFKDGSGWSSMASFSLCRTCLSDSGGWALSRFQSWKIGRA